MTTMLIFLVPVGLLAVAWSLCFVGCAFQTSGVEGPYSNGVINSPDLLAYWPLGDMPGAPPFSPPQGSTSLGTANDLSKNGGHNGSYIVPPLYPNPAIAQSATIPDNAVMLSLRQDSIVPGDVSRNGIVDLNLFPGSTAFNGGYVSIPWNTATSSSPQLSQFTFEAWIKPKWTGTGVVHVLFGALASDGTGFVIAVEDTNNLFQFIVGGIPLTTDVQLDLTRQTATYLAATFDPSNNGTISLWVNPQAVGDTNQPTAPGPNWTQQGTNYAATAPSQPVMFFIGAGRNDQAPRTADHDQAGAPEFPFQGQIQAVALYGSLLSADDILGDFNNGSSS